MEEIENSFAKRLPVARLAKVAGCSVPHLHEEFRRHMDTTPHQAVIQRRLQEARKRLLESRDSIKEISHACGFSDPAAFVRTFKLSTGTTPGTFRSHYLHT